jgi:hypothetical protein
MQDTFFSNRANMRSDNGLIDPAAPLLRMMMKIKAGVVTPSNEMRRNSKSVGSRAVTKRANCGMQNSRSPRSSTRRC